MVNFVVQCLTAPHAHDAHATAGDGHGRMESGRKEPLFWEQVMRKKHPRCKGQ